MTAKLQLGKTALVEALQQQAISQAQTPADLYGIACLTPDIIVPIANAEKTIVGADLRNHQVKNAPLVRHAYLATSLKKAARDTL